MKFRSRLFGVLALLSLAWMCYGVYASSSVASNLLEATVTPASGIDTETAQAARTVGVGIGAGIGLTFFLCSGIPFFLLFSLLSWRNSAGLRKEQMHQEQLNAIRDSGKSAAP